MPFPLSPRTRSGPRRRTLLASAAGVAFLTGCSGGPEDSGATGGSPSVADRARARAARDSGGLVDEYDAVMAVHPALAERLRPLRDETARHAEAFGDTMAKASPTVSAPSPAPSPVPSSEKDALARLAGAERALADRRAEALLDLPGELARLLASVAAAGAAHAYLLTEGER
ncbi:hypothetical protein StrepF001_28995 [Streptomyces sp. F001]|uniref:hypothetical protein n=1 Tax=Streptomyces sp. F001 TaxID=1510026 RepID=UPI00101E60AF|nr:hypothetical protein [Streptomyces sp. F001]RZB16200.1 hypothetical protein StrepF001_28995 [Streptomyces sp. F001]